VPIPWEGNKPAYGFNATGSSWLPQPASFAALARSEQEGVAGSTLELYKTLLRLRSEFSLGTGNLSWLDGYGENVLAFRNERIEVLANFGNDSVSIDEQRVLLRSGKKVPGLIQANSSCWLLRP